MHQSQGVLFAGVVATSERVAATAARTGKVAALAELLTQLDGDEVEATVGFLTGQLRQGRFGIGWATLSGAPASATSDVAGLTVLDLDAAIDSLRQLSGPGSTAARATELAALLARATVAEDSLIRRLLTGELRQGALDGMMTDAVAKAAGVPLAVVRRAVMLSGNLGRVAAVALDAGASGLEAIGLEVLRPLKPMLASAAADVGSALADCGVSSVEWKLDGARLQAHRRGDEVRLFTRSLRDVTDQLPAVVDLVRSFPATDFVLDGEMVGNAQARFFDCLHLDGTDLIDAPLTDRLGALERVAAQFRVPAIVTDDAGVAAAFLDSALAAGHEGVMVKTAASRYEAGRRGKAWRKVKPVKTVDLVVLAAEWGYGRRRGWLSNLHLGARDPAAGGFVMVGKTFKGLTDALLRWQTARFQEIKTDERDHVVFVRPELVVEIALDGVQQSTRYPGGVGLRFARVRGYRDDKGADEADTLDTLRAMLSQ